MSDYGVRLERIGNIAVITLDRPDRQNAMDEHMWICFKEVALKLQQHLPRAVVITGAGEKAFCAGFDVSLKSPMINLLAKSLETHEREPVESLISMGRAIDLLVD